MNIYVLFDMPDRIAFDNEMSIISDIKKKAREILGNNEISNVILHEVSGSTTSIFIVVDEMPANSGGAMNILNNFKFEVLDILSSYKPELKNKSIKIEMNANFKPKIPEKKSNFAQTKPQENDEKDSEFDYKQKAKNFEAVDPVYTFERVILSPKILEAIEDALNEIKYENKVFKEWGLTAIQPNPSTALNFYGAPGTGKTMVAEAIANKIGKKILKASYADVESKFHGEGPKMVKAIFLAAQEADALLFLDESDSLLSKRLTDVSDGSGQAINSMRSQLLICLEEFKGIVIFATNLIENYDEAFISRLKSIEFSNPDFDERKKIWEAHIYQTNENALNIPLAQDIDLDEIAEKFQFCGRSIRKAVIAGCVKCASEERAEVCQNDFINACEKILQEEENVKKAKNKINDNIKAGSRDDLKHMFAEVLKTNRRKGN